MRCCVGTQALNDNAKKWDALTRDGAAVLHGLRVDQFDVPDADIAGANARYKVQGRTYLCIARHSAQARLTPWHRRHCAFGV